MFALLRRSETSFLIRLYAPPGYPDIPPLLQAHPKPFMKLYKPRDFTVYTVKSWFPSNGGD